MTGFPPIEISHQIDIEQTCRTNVENFFRYTEEEGKKFFDDLDGDGDGIVTVEDLKKEMRRRNLPEKYAYR